MDHVSHCIDSIHVGPECFGPSMVLNIAQEKCGPKVANLGIWTHFSTVGPACRSLTNRRIATSPSTVVLILSIIDGCCRSVLQFTVFFDAAGIVAPTVSTTPSLGEPISCRNRLRRSRLSLKCLLHLHSDSRYSSLKSYAVDSACLATHVPIAQAGSLENMASGDFVAFLVDIH